jgi:hypothetical protein
MLEANGPRVPCVTEFEKGTTTDSGFKEKAKWGVCGDEEVYLPTRFSC